MNEIFFHEKIVMPLWVTFNDFFDKKLAKEVNNIKNNLKRWENDL